MHMKPQLVPSQVAVALAGGTHVFVQLPHVLTLRRSVSQPFPTMPSQFWKFMLHDAIWQVSVAHVPVALGGLQPTLHPPQWAVVLSRCSQPSPSLPLQFPQPGSHAPSTHVPVLQLSAALARLHAMPHARQFALVFRRSSQPFA